MEVPRSLYPTQPLPYRGSALPACDHLRLAFLLCLLLSAPRWLSVLELLAIVLPAYNRVASRNVPEEGQCEESLSVSLLPQVWVNAMHGLKLDVSRSLPAWSFLYRQHAQPNRKSLLPPRARLRMAPGCL